MKDTEPSSSTHRRAPDLPCLVAIMTIALAGTASAGPGAASLPRPNTAARSYDKKRDYPYPQSVEQEIARQLGAVYGPYTGTCFGSTRETDNEHIVAASEARDSGLCAKDRETQARFARDLRHSCASYRSNTLFL